MTYIAATTTHELDAWLDVSAMVVAAAFGAHVARVRRTPFLAVLLAGVIVGLGGGMTRDVLLGLEPAAIVNWYYVPAVLLAALISGAVTPQVTLAGLPFVAVQACSIGLLIGIGVQKAVDYDTPAASAILLGVITAAFGGVFGDVLAGRRATIMQESHWLLLAIVGGAVIFWPLTRYVGFYSAVIVTVIAVVVLRVASVAFDWASPVFPGDELPQDEV